MPAPPMAAHPKRATRQRPKRLGEASLLEAPSLLLRRIRGLNSKEGLTWLACVPLALFVLGVFKEGLIKPGQID